MVPTDFAGSKLNAETRWVNGMLTSEITPVTIDYILLISDTSHSTDEFFCFVAIGPPIPDISLVIDMTYKS